MAAIKTYTRPMTGWWRRNPFYGWYMLREMTSVIIVAYALFVLCGIYHLAQGQAAYERWRAVLSGGWSIFIHLLLFIVMLYHAWTWFKVMPKTLPFVRLGEERVADGTIIATGVVAAFVVSCTLFAIAKWITL
jgi:fumarate reductase subunit C